MKTLILLFVGACVLTKATAQDGYGSTSVYDRVATLPSGKHFFVIPPNKSFDQQNWRDSVYRFPDFEKGKLEMTNGFVPSHQPVVNYNIMFESIDIKQPTGEVVRMRKSPAIKFVWIGDHKFYNDPANGYVEIILEGKVTLAQKTYMDALYELSNGNRYPITSMMDTKIHGDKTTRYFWAEEHYLFLDKDLKSARPSPQLLKRLVPRHKSEIKSFARSNHIDWRNKEDLMKIIAYANELP